MPTKAIQEAVWTALPDDAEPYELARRRAFLQAHVEPGQAVLDLGCGAGAFTGLLAGWGAAPIGVDIAEEALRRARARHPTLDFRLAHADGALPLPEASIDVCWASEVLAHVPDTAGLLGEVRRVLRPRGALLVTTPDHGTLRRVALALRGFEQAFDPRGAQLRFYTARSLRELLEDFGFQIERMEGAGGAPLLRRLLMARARRAAPSIARG
ncbi:MAG: methyltransferase domain-containing protein [Actinomycetota bacterium]|nr:methyltransferase domain-containing protein [Actinomycetota bacterium]